MKKILSAVALLYCFLMTACEKETIIETITETDTLTITIKDTVTLRDTITLRDTVTRTINLDSALIAYYPFNGNANDESGNNKHGVLMNGTGFSTDAKNTANKAANFDGVNDYINISDATNYFAPPKMSVSFHLNLRNATARGMIFNKGNFSTASGVTWGAGIYPNGELTMTIGDPTTGCSAPWFDNPIDDLHARTVFQSNQWYHVTIIYNQGVELIYINGAFSSAKVDDYSSLKQCSTANLKIGGWWQNDVVSINGKIDEIRIYDRVLAENEIKKLAEGIN